MSVAGSLRAAALLARLAGGGGGGAAPEARPLGEVACDWYRARGRRRATVVALHGVTVNGKDDRRLQAFGRALAVSGATVVVPTLPGLASLRWDAADLTAIGTAIETATASGHRAVVVGFSHGASLGLLAAARAGERVGRVLCFGAYHSLSRVAASLRALPEPRSERDCEDVVYAQLVEARRRADELGLPEAVRAAADDLLRRYCSEASALEKLRFFREHLRPLGLASRPESGAEAAAAALSPEGNLAGLSCAVDLVHDPDDLLVPASEADALLAELDRAAPGHRHRLLVTRLVRHVSGVASLRPGEALRLVEMMAPLVGG